MVQISSFNSKKISKFICELKFISQIFLRFYQLNILDEAESILVNERCRLSLPNKMPTYELIEERRLQAKK